MARFDSLSKVFLLRPYSLKGDYIYKQRSMAMNWMPKLATIHAIFSILFTTTVDLHGPVTRTDFYQALSGRLALIDSSGETISTTLPSW